MFLILIFETSEVWVIVRSENPNIVAQSLSHVWLFAALWMAAEKDRERPPPSPGVHSDSRISSRWCHPTTSSLSSPSPPTFNLSQHQGLSNESVSHIRYPKYWSFSFSISSSSEYSGLISFRMDWFDLLAVQGTLRSLFQHHSCKVSVLRCSAFFMVQLSYPCVTTEKNHSFDYMDLCQQSNVSAF